MLDNEVGGRSRMARMPLLKRLEAHDREFILSQCTPFFAARGTFIFTENEVAKKIFFIQKGKVRVHKQIDDGREITIFIRQADDACGEIGIFSGNTYSCSARAEEDCQIYFMDKAHMEGLLVNNGAIALEFIRWAAESLEASSSKLKDYLMYQSGGALASILVRLVNMYGEKVEGGYMIENVPTNYELALHIGSTRETVNRFLNIWKSQGIVTAEHKSIMIHDMEYLKGLLGCNECGVQNCVI